MYPHKITSVTTELNRHDLLGAIKVRLGIGRNDYRVSPGLYALGSPNDASPVLVTANYKLTFDSLRKELTGQSLWILVLDTKGVNVWCAAGKGTFGTAELIRRVYETKLHQAVSHRKLILPQLGAPGVAAHEVMKSTGFKVVYGPIKAADIPAFLENNMQATKQMRQVEFTLSDRIAVIPVEFNYVFKLLPALFAFFFVFNLIAPGGFNLTQVLFQSVVNLIPYIIAFALGTIGIAILLPYIPFRSFALKGALLGIVWALIFSQHHHVFMFPESNLIITANFLILTAITSFFALNFTGSTTYTSISGVQKETLYSIPVMGAAVLLGLIFLIIFKVRLFIG